MERGSTRYAVIGAGLIGSAAARHLAQMGHDVTLIGPGEPADWATHEGVFASHYDEGRITRGLDSMPFWAQASRASIARYAEIEAASGIPFFQEVGGLMAGPDMEAAAQEGRKGQVSFEELTPSKARGAFGFVIPDGFEVLHEAADAGHISPRRLVAAQQRAAAALGCKRIEEVVRHTEDGRVTTDKAVHHFDQVLWAAGGFGAPHLDLPLDVQGRTVTFFEVAGPMPDLPTLIFANGVEIDIYLLPPIQYADGKHYFKIGGGPHDKPLRTEGEMRAWYQSGGDPAAAQALDKTFRALVPDVEVISTHWKPCVTMYAPDELPFIGRLDPATCVATAGNGRGAKCSDELGRLGAMALLGEEDPALAPMRFRP
ncbi:MAG: FAD-binding oxidoreductase [Rhodobacteraceae bacterium]|nr:FAD-binding oxidoreductase [Paracoccaceae bacterium]